MDGLFKDAETKEVEEEILLKKYFVPLTNAKAITWLVVTGFFVYASMLLNGFVWDDKNIVIPTAIKNGTDILKIFSNSDAGSSYYRPIAALFYSIVYAGFGASPFSFHFPQLIIHIVNTFLVFLLFKKFLNKYISFLLALVFLIHPMQVESVSYISGLNSSLFFFFGLCAMLLSTKKHISLKRLIAIFSFLLLSLLTQETGILFLFFIPLFRYLLHKDQLRIFTLLSVLDISIYLLLRFYIEKIIIYKDNILPLTQLPLGMRLLSAPQIILYYVKTFFFPMNLAIQQVWYVKQATLTSFYLPLILVLVFVVFITYTGIIFYRKKIYSSSYIFFASWLVLGLSLHLQLFPLDMTVADRWFYFPMVGILGIIGVILQSQMQKIYKHKTLVIVTAIVILIILSLRTIARNADWQNPITLYTHDSQVMDSYNIEGNLGFEYQSVGMYDKAMIHYKKAIKLLPFEGEYLDMAFIYELQGHKKQAKIAYLNSINAKSAAEPSHRHLEATYNNIGRFFFYFDSPVQANKYIKQGLMEYPDDITLWILLALDDYKLGDQANALSAIKHVSAIYPTNKYINSIYMRIFNKQPVEIPIQRFYTSG